MASIDNISIAGFKSLFSRDFPYLPVWQEGKAYFKGDVAYYNGNFYINTADNTSEIPDATNTYYTQKQIDAMMNKIDTDIETLSGTVSGIKVLPTYGDLDNE